MKVFLKLFFVFWIFFFATSEKGDSSIALVEDQNYPVSLVQFDYSSNGDAIQNQHSFEVFSNASSNFIKDNSRSLYLFFASNSITNSSFIASKNAILKIHFSEAITFYFTSLQVIFPFHYFW